MPANNASSPTALVTQQSLRTFEEPSAALVTAHILLQVDLSSPERWEVWRRGIRNAARNFKGYRGIRHIDLGPIGVQEEGKDVHQIAIIIKFESYANMRVWIDSEERQHWLDLANEVELFPNSMEREVHLVDKDGVVLDLATAIRPGAAGEPEEQIKTPARWRLFLVVWSGVMPMTLLNGAAGTLPKIQREVEDQTFAIYVFLAHLVPIIAYAVVPLFLRLGLAAFLRARFPSNPISRLLYSISLVSVLGSTLEEGLGLFQPPKNEPDPRLLKRIEKAEGRIEALKETTNRLRRRLRDVKASMLVEKGVPVEAACDHIPRLDSRRESEEVDDEALASHFAWRGSTGDEDLDELLTDEEIKEDRLANVEDAVEGLTMVGHYHVRWERTEEFEEEMTRFSHAMSRFAGDQFMGLDLLTNSESGKLQYISIFRFRNFETMRRWMQSEERKRELRRLHPLLEGTRGRETTYELLAVDPFSGLQVDEDTLRNLRSSQATDTIHPSQNDFDEELGQASALTLCFRWNLFGSWWLPLLFNSTKTESTRHIHSGEEIGLMLRDVFGDTLTLSKSDHRALPPPVWKTTFLTWLSLAPIVSIVSPRLGSVLADAGASVQVQAIVVTFVSNFANIFVGAPFVTFLFGNWLVEQDAASAAKGQDPLIKILVLGLPNAFWMLFVIVAYILVLILGARAADAA